MKRKEECVKAVLAVATALAISCPVTPGHAEADQEQAKIRSGIPGKITEPTMAKNNPVKQKLDWTRVKEDSYYQSRELEERARQDGKPQTWKKFGDQKAKKGSYMLAVLGYFNAALLFEQVKHITEADALYDQAFAICVRAGYKELAVLVTARQSAMSERNADTESAARSYERLGAFCEKEGALFLAADAYEHAAEMLVKSGVDVSGYLKPLELWERNARYWEERGNLDDALWSRQHAELYKRLVNTQPTTSVP